MEDKSEGIHAGVVCGFEQGLGNTDMALDDKLIIIQMKQYNSCIQLPFVRTFVIYIIQYLLNHRPNFDNACHRPFSR